MCSCIKGKQILNIFNTKLSCVKEKRVEEEKKIVYNVQCLKNGSFKFTGGPGIQIKLHKTCS